MPSKKTASSRNKRSRATGARTRSRAQGTAGDIPPRQRTDYLTASVNLPKPTGTLSFRQLAPLQTFTATAGAVTTPVINFALSGVSGASTLSSLFDFYRIDAVRVTVRPNNTAIALHDPTVTSLLPIYWVIDYNDSAVLATAAAATEYDNCMILSPSESGARSLRPMYLLQAKSAAGTDYISDVGAWLPTVNDDVLHYGCKFFIPAASAAQTFLQTWTVELEYYFTFRNVS